MLVLRPETANQKRSPRKISWDVLRVVAVYSVVVQHITHQSPINHAELGPYPFKLPLQFGASTLLVISAFFVCVTVRRGATKRWLFNRVARLLPAYLVAVVVTYCVSRATATAFGWYLPTHTDLLANLFLVQAWAPDFHWIDASYWTLPVQLMSFVAAALLWPRGRLRGRALTVTLWTLVVAPLVIRYLWRGDDSAQWVKSVFDGLALHRVALFGVGVAIWLWTRHRMSGAHLAGYLVAALVAQDAHAYFTDTPSTVAFGVVLVGIVAAAGGPDWDIPGIRHLAGSIRWLAGISFGVYLVHQELGFVLARYLLDAGIGPWGRLFACSAMAVLLGWAITHLVERPAHAWLVAHGPTAWARLRALATNFATVARPPHEDIKGRKGSEDIEDVVVPAARTDSPGDRKLDEVAMATSPVR
ncbi:acyltransferase family protein [Actinokineospora inagensis]|uniref:acyltransferase family protein n=1 Tax=Actinokineospora inagensis TaxID=103730 RepID=UPI0006888CDF|nr:acyltransferase [Actinokineospora inagensis]